MMYAAKAHASVVGLLLAILVGDWLDAQPTWVLLDQGSRLPLTVCLQALIVWGATFVGPPNRYEDQSMPPAK